MRVLFFGYTFHNDLPEVILQMAEDDNPHLSFSYTKVVYGGRTLENHWTQYSIPSPSPNTSQMAKDATPIRRAP